MNVGDSNLACRTSALPLCYRNATDGRQRKWILGLPSGLIHSSKTLAQIAFFTRLLSTLIIELLLLYRISLMLLVEKEM